MNQTTHKQNESIIVHDRGADYFFAAPPVPGRIRDACYQTGKAFQQINAFSIDLQLESNIEIHVDRKGIQAQQLVSVLPLKRPVIDLDIPTARTLVELTPLETVSHQASQQLDLMSETMRLLAQTKPAKVTVYCNDGKMIKVNGHEIILFGRQKQKGWNFKKHRQKLERKTRPRETCFSQYRY